MQGVGLLKYVTAWFANSLTSNRPKEGPQPQHRLSGMQAFRAASNLAEKSAASSGPKRCLELNKKATGAQ